ELVGEANGKLIVPVNILNGNGIEISGADIWIDYDSAVIKPIQVESRPLADGYEWVSNADDPIGIPGDTQRLKINITNTIPTPIYGSGSLFRITFDVVGDAGDRAELNLREFIPSLGGSTLNTAAECIVPLLLIDGQVSVLAENDADYQLGDVNGDGRVSLEDSAAALAASSGAIPKQPIVVDAGDINGDQQVTASDGVQILTYLQTGKWPTGSEPIIDVRAGQGTNDVIFSLTDVVGQPGGNVAIDLAATGLEGGSALDLTLVYDTAVIDGVEEITLLEDALLFELFDYHVVEPGRVEISLGSRLPLEGSASLLQMTFKLAADAPNISHPPLYIADAQIGSLAGLDFVTNYPGNSILLDDAQITLRDRSVYLPFLLDD
ncbi:MAG: dockerin type I domain-containing protein, partial [Chloroflexota bacterium]